MPYYLGLMSGTSVDGVDVALVDVREGSRAKISARLCAFKTYSFPSKIKSQILKVSHEEASVSELCGLHYSLGKYFAEVVHKSLSQFKISPKKIRAVGSHGQTVCHLGSRGTLQIGEASYITEKMGIPVVSDFRARDIAAGGVGAPLMPKIHQILFGDTSKIIAVNNIGGISNVTYLHPRYKVMGFDTGPGNMIMDGIVRHFSKGRKHHDERGRLASRGHIHLQLLKEVLRHPFITEKPPKSCGREEFGEKFLKNFLKRGEKFKLRLEDYLATATAFTAASIADNYRHFLFPKGMPDEVVLCGGGVHNETLLHMLRAELAGISVKTTEEKGYSSDALEAMGFGLFAHLALEGQSGNLPEVTGAKRAVVLGKKT